MNMLPFLRISENKQTIFYGLFFIVYQSILFIYADEILFGSVLHNYCLMLRSGKLSDVVNDWHAWKRYFVQVSKRDANTSLSQNGLVLKGDNITDFCIPFLISFIIKAYIHIIFKVMM